jgi:hypothetical protein
MVHTEIILCKDISQLNLHTVYSVYTSTAAKLRSAELESAHKMQSVVGSGG